MSTAPTLPSVRITPRGLGVVGVVWAVYAVLYSLAITAFAGVPFAHALPSQLGYTVLMAVLSAPAWWVIVRGMAGRPWSWIVLAHGLGAVLYTAVVVSAFLAWARVGGGEAYAAVSAEAGWIAVGTALAYVTQFAVYHAVEAGRRSRAREAQAEALRHLSREQELRALHAQLNPHFLFNALNTISADVVRDPEGARESIGQLAGMLRYALDAGRRDLVPLDRELDFVRDTLALEGARMGARLEARLDVDDRALAADVPPMAVQTLVENAIRHGLAPSRAGGALTVTVRHDGTGVEVEVADTGVGAQASAAAAGSGIGLANTDERLRLLFGDAAGLRIERDRPRGFAVAFRLPLDPEPAEPGRTRSAPLPEASPA